MGLTVVFLAVFAFAHTSIASVSLTIPPGMVVYCTEECLAMWYTENMFGEELRAKLNNTRLPDISGNVSSILWSSFGYDYKNITLKNYTDPEVHVQITEEKGIVMTVIVPEMSFEGNVILTHSIGDWNQYNGMGNCSLSLRKTSVIMERKTILGSDLEAITYESLNGNCSIEELEIVCHHQVLDELLAQIDRRELKRLAEGELCKSYKFLTKTTFNASYHFTPDIYLDKTFLDQPIIHHGYIEVHHRGEVRDISDNEAFRSLPSPMEPISPERMKDYRLSEYLFNSFGNIVHKRQLLWYTYTKEDLPQGHESLLDTSCEQHCFGTLFPTAGNNHSNSTVELKVSTAKPLRVQITEAEFRVNFTLEMAAHARQENGNSTFLFLISQELSAKVDVIIKDSKIHFEMQHPDSNIKIINSAIGQLSEDKLLTVVELAYQKVLVSALAYFRHTGFDLGVPHPFSAARSEVKYNKGDVLIMFDYLKE